jgi:hypothetical protein
MISFFVDSSIVVTLHRHVGAERRHGGGVSRQPFETGLKDAPVFGSDSGSALMRQPDFHAGQLPQQCSELFEDPITRWTQAGIVGGEIHAFLLGERFAWMLKDVLLLNARRAFEPQVHDSGEFVGREALASDQFQNVGLVACGQPHELTSRCRRQQSHL